MDHPPLPASVVVLPGTDVEETWEYFKVYEALHHRMDIMNPLAGGELDAVLAALGVADGDRVLDVACGHGELLLRLAERDAVDGIGIDLSPWQIRRAEERAAAREVAGTLCWWLGDAADLPARKEWDAVTCLGATWIWDGFEGTVRALASMCRDGGSIAVGDIQRRPGLAASDLDEGYAMALSRDQQSRVLESLGIVAATEIVAARASWDGYQDRVRESAEAWALLHPGEEASRYLAEQAAWAAEHERVAEQIDWTVWIGRVGGAGE